RIAGRVGGLAPSAVGAVPRGFDLMPECSCCCILTRMTTAMPLQNRAPAWSPGPRRDNRRSCSHDLPAPPCLCALDQAAIVLDVFWVATSRSRRPELTFESDHGVRVTKSASPTDCLCQWTACPHCGCGWAGACDVKGRPKRRRSHSVLICAQDDVVKQRSGDELR